MSNIDDVLEKWDESKKKLSFYEKETEKYREAVERYMNKKNINTLKGTVFNVTRRSNTRETMSKKDVSDEIWNRYCNKFTYYSYHLKSA